MSSVGGTPGFDFDELFRSFGVAADGIGLGGDFSGMGVVSRHSDFCVVCWLDGHLLAGARSGLVEETAHSFLMLEEFML